LIVILFMSMRIVSYLVSQSVQLVFCLSAYPALNVLSFSPLALFALIVVIRVSLHLTRVDGAGVNARTRVYLGAKQLSLLVFVALFVILQYLLKGMATISTSLSFKLFSKNLVSADISENEVIPVVQNYERMASQLLMWQTLTLRSGYTGVFFSKVPVGVFKLNCDWHTRGYAVNSIFFQNKPVFNQTVPALLLSNGLRGLALTRLIGLPNQSSNAI
jgi:hypothetical protein